MFSKSLVVFTVIGVMAGLLYGIYLLDIKNTNQLVFSEGPSLSVVTDKSDFKKGEAIRIRIINSGTVPLLFSDTSYGLKITGLSGMLMYSPPSYPVQHFQSLWVREMEVWEPQADFPDWELQNPWVCLQTLDKVT